MHLLEVTDFQAFRVDIPSGSQISEISGKIGPAVVFESEQVGWVSESWLREQGTDAAWSDRLATMVEKARTHGWVRDEPELAIRREALSVSLTADLNAHSPVRLATAAGYGRSIACRRT